jgi:hypothetical protein
LLRSCFCFVFKNPSVDYLQKPNATISLLKPCPRASSYLEIKRYVKLDSIITSFRNTLKSMTRRAPKATQSSAIKRCRNSARVDAFSIVSLSSSNIIWSCASSVRHSLSLRRRLSCSAVGAKSCAAASIFEQNCSAPSIISASVAVSSRTVDSGPDFGDYYLRRRKSIAATSNVAPIATIALRAAAEESLGANQ